MCFTGGFALGMMVDDVVVAPVLSQPSLPVPGDQGAPPRRRDSRPRRHRPGSRSGRPPAPACSGSGSPATSSARPSGSSTSASCSATRFVAVELDSSAGNPHGHKKTAHSVLTEDLDDRPGTPTRDALDQVLDFFAERLLA